ncbi:hypothetical protein TH53_01055 [Pedobacter lusitanus]|uniref:HTH araC/xylS-type domain-containing protein n=1 Tax=Pedobacter lusitanus TaxID=1503925 RepID=A0A0D0GRT2_9SPHI|nr:AraC family transcriptional regulator [Pedobacter lusitanus]KIO78920.1 hypothetical protein TH53_01055 [Pedobacter lusitanus]
MASLNSIKRVAFPGQPEFMANFLIEDLKNIKLFKGIGVIPDNIHQHSYFAVFFTESGDGVHLIDGAEYSFREYNVHLLQPDVGHQFKSIDNLSGKVLLINLESIIEENFGLSKEIYNLFANTSLSPVLKLSPKDFHSIMTIINLMDKDEETIESSNHTMLGNSLITALLLLLKPHLVMKNNAVKNISTIFHEFNKNLHLFFQGGYSIAAYAEKLKLAERKFNQMIKKKTGMTPQQLINERKLFEATRFLLSTDLLVQEIAYKLDYADAAHFIRVFKKAKGYSPNSFRKINGYMDRHVV